MRRYVKEFANAEYRMWYEALQLQHDQKVRIKIEVILNKILKLQAMYERGLISAHETVKAIVNLEDKYE